MSRRLQLEGDLRQALENYFGDMLSGPWDEVISTFARCVFEGQVTLDHASRLAHAFAHTHGPERAPDACATCGGAEGMRW